jgi:hypothetical protein
MRVQALRQEVMELRGTQERPQGSGSESLIPWEWSISMATVLRLVLEHLSV